MVFEYRMYTIKVCKFHVGSSVSKTSRPLTGVRALPALYGMEKSIQKININIKINLILEYLILEYTIAVLTCTYSKSFEQRRKEKMSL